MKSMKPKLFKITYLDFNGIKLYLILKYSKLRNVYINENRRNAKIN